MKASAVIDLLKNLIEDHGDMEVVYFDHRAGKFLNAKGVRVLDELEGTVPTEFQIDFS